MANGEDNIPVLIKNISSFFTYLKKQFREVMEKEQKLVTTFNAAWCTSRRVMFST